MGADRTFLAELGTSCATKTQEWGERSKTRADELVALAETIKILNDDDALELFKKTLPGAASFMQITASHKVSAAHAAAALRPREHRKDYRVDAILLSLAG